MDSDDLLNARPLQNCSYQEFRDPADLHTAYTSKAQCREFVSLVPEASCLHLVGFLMVNNTPLLGSVATSFIARPEQSTELGLMVLFQGSVALRSKTGAVENSSGGVVLASALVDEMEVRGSRCAIRLQPTAIAHASAAMRGLTSGPTRQCAQQVDPHRPISLGASHPQAAAIHGLIRYIDACFAVGAQVPMRLGLDDQIHRVVATLIQPELLSEEPGDLGRLRERGGKDAFDELIDYIRANLDQPLRLSDLEVRSHYSRRALQYAFQERLGCTPKQWIREQRLALALEQLQAEGPRPRINSVSLGCGYLSPAHFSRDFKQRYGITPLQAGRA